MTKLQRLELETTQLCLSLGHRMRPFNHDDSGKRAASACWDCEKGTLICTNPLPNEIEISGEAVTSLCKKEEQNA